MLTRYFSKTDIRQQERQGIIEVDISFVHTIYYNEQILSYMFCLRFFGTSLVFSFKFFKFSHTLKNVEFGIGVHIVIVNLFFELNAIGSIVNGF